LERAVNLFDIFILCIVTFCLIRGVFRGLIKEGVSLIGLIAGFCAASYYYVLIAELLFNWISSETYFRTLGFFTVLLGIVIITNVLIPPIKSILGIDFIRGVDISIGAGVGIIKGLIVSCIMLIVFSVFFPRGASFIADSRFSINLIRISEKIILVSPHEMKNEFTEKIDFYKKTWTESK
jgi:membrane protein required for colicin V production